MKISVVICTHNRADSLRRTLQSLGKQTLPVDEFEVLVVDNASTDDTQTVVKSCTSLPVRYLHEPILGLSVARNTGWQNATTNYVAFLDDDAVAAPGWLEHILQTFDSAEGEEVVVGGRVVLALPVPKPAWLDDSLLFCLGELTGPPGISTLSTTSLYLPGCNIAFKKSTLLQLHGFPTLLGRTGSTLLSGEEILLQKKVVAGGGAVLYHHQASVTHHIEADRLTKKWFMRRMYWEGVSTKRIEKILQHHTPLGHELVALVRQLFSIRFVFRRTFQDSCTATRRLGRIKEAIWPH